MAESSSIFFELQEKEKLLCKQNYLSTLQQQQAESGNAGLEGLQLHKVSRSKSLQLVLFEQLVWESLFPVLSVCYQHLLNVDDYTRVIVHIFKNMVLVSAQYPEALQTPLHASLNALIGFTGVAGMQQLIQGERGAFVVGSIIKMMKTSLIRLKPVWKDLYSFVAKLRVYFPEFSARTFSFTQQAGSQGRMSVIEPQDIEDGAMLLFSAVPKSEITELYHKDFHRLDARSQPDLFRAICQAYVEELKDGHSICLVTFDCLWAILHHNDKVFSPEKMVSYWESLTNIVTMVFQSAVAKGTSWSELLQREIVDKIMSLLKKVLGICRSEGRDPSMNKMIFEALYKVHKSKNDPRYSETLIDTSLEVFLSANDPNLCHGWLFLTKASMDIVNNSSLSWRTPVKQKILSVSYFLPRY